MNTAWWFLINAVRNLTSDKLLDRLDLAIAVAAIHDHHPSHRSVIGGADHREARFEGGEALTALDNREEHHAEAPLEFLAEQAVEEGGDDGRVVAKHAAAVGTCGHTRKGQADKGESE